jgi:AcrR family transcriptional regulator
MTSGQQVEPVRSAARERRRERARVDVARVAMRLFSERGYEATTVQDIAEAADISYRTFFRYFATKEDVVFPDVERHLEILRARIGGIPAGEHPWPTVRRGLTEVIDLFDEPGPDFSAATMRVWLEDPGMAAPFARFNRRWSAAIADAWRVPDADPALAAEVCGRVIVAAMLGAFRVYLDRGTGLRALVDAALDRIEPAVS